jgi:hypothetical protein
MDPAKVTAVAEWTYPKNKKGLQMFLGFANFYRHFIQSFSYLMFPLTRLLLKDAPFVWMSTCATAFDTLKLAFTSFPGTSPLRFPVHLYHGNRCLRLCHFVRSLPG